MTDRDLLITAAQAAGIEGGYVDVAYIGCGIAPDDPDGGLWNPLTNDGDALRLAVQCGLNVSFVDDQPDLGGRDTRACVGYSTRPDPPIRYVFEDNRGDIFAATRRAIVRAAAEIGKGGES